MEATETKERPIRIQRKRSKGWRMPPNTVYVGRPTIYANPFSIDYRGRYWACEQYLAYVIEGKQIESPGGAL